MQDILFAAPLLRGGSIALTLKEKSNTCTVSMDFSLLRLIFFITINAFLLGLWEGKIRGHNLKERGIGENGDVRKPLLSGILYFSKRFHSRTFLQGY